MAPRKKSEAKVTKTPEKRTRAKKVKPVELTPGSRFYPIIKDGETKGVACSVTTILSNTESEKAKERLVNWGKGQEQAKSQPGYIEPRERGTKFDDIVSGYCRTQSEFRKLPSLIGLHPEVAAMVNNFIKPTYNARTKQAGPSFLELFGKCIWVQGVVPADYTDGLEAYKHVDSRGNAREYLASLEHGFAGTPDIIGEFKGELTLISLKTSNCDYRKTHPGYEALNEREKGAPPPEEWRKAYGGYMKYSKAVMQECAYRLALIETMGITLDNIAILVSTPERAQAFYLTQYEIENGTKLFLERCKAFYETYGHLAPKEITEII